MPRPRPLAAAVAALLALGTACGPEDKTAQVTVMSRNLYLGADLDPILFALVGFETGQISPSLFNAVIGPLANQAWAEVQATDFPARAKVIAGEIASQRPDLVGLQEVALWRTGNAAAPPATTVAYDFVELLRAELANLGLSYQVADEVIDTDGEFPLAVPLADGSTLVRFTDRDVILARADVAWSSPRHANYVAAFPLLTASGPIGIDLSVLRGWTSVEVQKDGVRFRVYETHLEVENPPLNYFQAGQASELAGILTAEPLPAIVLGDFNSDGNQKNPVSATPTYPLMRDLGFGDPWADLHPGDPGESFCGATDATFTALNPCDARLDHNFYRGGFTPLAAGEITMTATPSGIYDSDHKAMWTSFSIKVPGAR